MWVGGSAIMFVLIMFTFLAWTRQSQRNDGRGWLEAARRDNLEHLTGVGVSPAAASAASPGTPTQPGPPGPPSRPARPDIDPDEDQLAAYNAFLARLNQGGHRPPS
jgi:hypothetical protein